ncbi:MAG: PP2C family protein-serine/threonine phosphatase, partial [Planctomycetota bacterium]
FNRFLSRDIKNVMFLTVMYMVLNIHTRTLQITNAGHNPLILLRGGKHQLINPTGMAVGFDLGPLFEKTLRDSIIQLQPGDRVIVYTDGVVEAMDKAKQEFGMERFLEIVHETGSKSSGEFLNTLMRDLDRWQGRGAQNDDITVLTFKYTGEPEPVASRAVSGITESDLSPAADYASSDYSSGPESEYESSYVDSSSDSVSEGEVPARAIDPPGFESVDGIDESDEAAYEVEEIPEYVPDSSVPETEPAELTPFPETEPEGNPREDMTSESSPEELMETLLETEQLASTQQNTEQENEGEAESGEKEDVVDLSPKPNQPPTE